MAVLSHNDYMKMALALALKAQGKTSPNPLVGAVIVKNKKIIARAYHHHCGGAHAEAIALKKAGIRARGAKLYVTLEPCAHFGRTPPCVDNIIKSGLKEIYIGIKDPNPLTCGKSIVKLRRRGIKTTVGFLAGDIKKVNEFFIKYITRKMPFVAAKCAQTLDGKIATARGKSKWITGEKSRKYGHFLRNDFDAILVGVNTVLRDNPYLNAARTSKRIKKIVLDSSLRISLNANLFLNTDPEDVIIATTSAAKKYKVRKLLKRGVTVMVCPNRRGRVALSWLFKELAKKEIMSILIEGGARAIGSALKEKLIDKMFIFMAPAIMGDAKALGSVAGLGSDDISRLVKLKNITYCKIGEDILMEAYVHGNR